MNLSANTTISFDWMKLLEFIWPAGVVVVLVLTPWFDSLIFRVFKRNTEKLDVMIHESFIRRKDSVKATILGMFPDEITQRQQAFEKSQEALRLAEANEDAIEALESSILQQGQVLKDHIEQVFTPLTNTLIQINANLHSLTTSTTENARAIARIEGAMGNWDGNNRRNIIRREEDLG